MTTPVPTPPDADGGLGEELRQFIVANRWFCLGEQRIASHLAALLARAHEKGRAEERNLLRVAGFSDLCTCESMRGSFGSHRDECPTTLARRSIARDTQGGSDAGEVR